jgi:hypothetical protein
MCRLTGTVPAASVRTVGDVLSLLGQYPLTGEGAALTRRAVGSRTLWQRTPRLFCSR